MVQIEHLDSALAHAESATATDGLLLAIGNFDGVHLGHQAILRTLTEQARAQNLTSAVLVFEPQPREWLDPDNAPARLSNLAEKTALIAACGVERIIVARFDEVFRCLSAQAFADQLATLGVKGLLLGDDFRFGQDRTGDGNFLQEQGFAVTHLDTICDDPATLERVSSTRIRAYLQQGDLTAAARLLGRDYTITGTVLHGDKIGRTLNFPTANIALARIRPPLHGIYGVDVWTTDGTPLTDLAQDGQAGVAGFAPNSLFGAASVGTRPTVQGETWRLEVFFPQFSGDLYGRELCVRFLHFLHGERNYNGLDALKAGIRQDVVDLLAWRDAQRLV